MLISPLVTRHNAIIFLLLLQQILQRTPIRVLHRRSPLDREKIIHWYGHLYFVLKKKCYPALFECVVNV